MDENPEARSRKWAWLPAEVPWLLAMALLFWWLSGKYWDLHIKALIYDRKLAALVPWIFVIAAGYAWLRAVPRPTIAARFTIDWNLLPELALAYLGVLFVQKVDPILYVDDAGFILRYFDHFAEGCFYCFNISEGPVFGISSFIYGLIGGIISWTHILTPEQTLNTLTYVGIFAMGFLFLRILRHLVESFGLVVVLWFLVMTCSHSASLILNSGMEAPFHFSIVLAAIYFFLRDKDRFMWFFLALSVISKLDAVPMVVVIAFAWTVRNWGDLTKFDWHKRRYVDALLYGLLPVLVWIVFAILVFGSPLPQSAFAKVYFHNHAKGSWFPFINGFITNPASSIFLGVSLTLFVAHVGFVAARRKGGREVILGFAFIATLLLYFLYNPGEQMLWYYVMPEGLMLLQLAVSLHWLWSWLPQRKWLPLPLVAVCIVVGMGLILSLGYASKYWAYIRDYEKTVEFERARIGDYMASVVAPDDTLLAGHGLVGRKVQGFVLDQTGLNCKLSTQFATKNDSLARTFLPAWIVMHGNSWEVDKLNDLPYVLDTTFYDIATYSYAPWRVLRKVSSIEESAGNYFPGGSIITGDSITWIEEPANFVHCVAKAFAIRRDQYNVRDWKLTFGLLRHDADYTMIVRDIVEGNKVIWEKRYEIPHFEGFGTPRICPITVPLIRDSVPQPLPAGQRFITLQFENAYGRVNFYDLGVHILRKDP